MKKNRFLSLFAAVLLLNIGLLLNACSLPAEADSSNTVPTADTAEDIPDAVPLRTISPETAPVSQDVLSVFRSGAFFHGDTEWSFCISSSAMPDENGEPMLDDSNRFRITVTGPAGEYLLFDDTVQLGVPELDIYETYQEDQIVLHLVIRDVRTALYRITDYAYDPAAAVFVEHSVLDDEGINFIGSY